MWKNTIPRIPANAGKFNIAAVSFMTAAAGNDILHGRYDSNSAAAQIWNGDCSPPSRATGGSIEG
jgi:hypothetical protein